jgi:endonuclease YncB( thermonuclease family)
MAGEDRVGEPVGAPVHKPVGGRVHKLVPPAAALVLSVALVLIGGRALEQPAAFEMPGPEDFAVSHDPVTSTSVEAELSPDVPDAARGLDEPASEVLLAPAPAGDLPDEQFLPETPAPGPAEALAASRQVTPAGDAPPGATNEELQREAPRDPLSQLSLALPPQPEPKNPWAGKPLFRPVATESAVFESGGQTISIDGVESIAPEETCSHDGADWACGVRARAAFRAWLRGRAVVCQLPEGQDEAAMRGKCRLAKEDVGEWLVENGWAIAATDGPYAQVGEKAKADGRGVFGAPPDTSGVGDVPEIPANPLPSMAGQSILSEDSADLPQGTPRADPFQPAAPRMAFPPAPPAP